MDDSRVTALGTRVGELLKENERTVKWLARTSGISYTTLRRHLASPGDFTTKELVMIADAFHVDVQWLQTGQLVAA